MIISASRRTNLPAFYAEWLIQRFRAGYCLAGCRYCCATASFERSKANYRRHDPRSPLQVGWPPESDSD